MRTTVAVATELGAWLGGGTAVATGLGTSAVERTSVATGVGSRVGTGVESSRPQAIAKSSADINRTSVALLSIRLLASHIMIKTSEIIPSFPICADNDIVEPRGCDHQGYRFCQSKKADPWVGLFGRALVLLNDCGLMSPFVVPRPPRCQGHRCAYYFRKVPWCEDKELCWDLGWLHGDVESEVLKPADNATLYGVAIPLIEVVGAEVAVGFSPDEQMIGDDQDRVGYNQSSPLGSAACSEPTVQGAQVGLGPCGCSGGLHHRFSQPWAPLTSSSRLTFSRALIVPGA